MKKILLLCLMAFSLCAFAQIPTDANGNKITGPTIAIFTTIRSFVLNGQKMTQTLTKKQEQEISTVFNMAAINAAQADGLTICNRDESMMAEIKKMLEEQKAEEYMMGLTVSAKNIGAKTILLQEICIYSNEKSKYAEWEFHYRFLNVENNCAHHFLSTAEFAANNEKKLQSQITEFATKHVAEIKEMFKIVEPNLFNVAQLNGSKAMIAATRTCSFSPNDVFYFTKIQTHDGNIRGIPLKFTEASEVATGKNPSVQSGLIKVELDNSIKESNNVIVSTTASSNLNFMTEGHMAVSVIELPVTEGTYSDYNATKINNALNNAITQKTYLALIENANLDILKRERELQKTEEFIDGQVVEQYKACGTKWVIKLSELNSNPKNSKLVSFKMNLYNIETQTVEKSFSIKDCHISNLDDAFDYYLSRCFFFTCTFKKFHTSKPSLLVSMKLNALKDNVFTLLYNKPIKNALTGENTYARVELAKLNYVEGAGQLHTFKVSKMLDKKTFKELEQNYGGALLMLVEDRIEPKAKDLAKDNTKEKRVKKDDKKKGGLKAFFADFNPEATQQKMSKFGIQMR